MMDNTQDEYSFRDNFMKLFKRGFGLFAFVAITLLPGCTKQHKIETKKIQAISLRDADYQQTQNNIILRAKLLDRDECAQLTGRKKTKAFHKSTKIIQFTTINNGVSSLLLKQKNIDLKLIPHKTICQTYTSSAIFNGLMSSMGAYIVTITAGSLLFTLVLKTVNASFFILALGVDMLALGVLGITPTIGIIKGVRREHKNTEMLKRLDKLALHKPTIIYAGNHKNKLIFVQKKDYKPQFDLTIVDNNKKTTFNIDLNQNS